jgi:diacylglycerol kinase (ATP)
VRTSISRPYAANAITPGSTAFSRVVLLYNPNAGRGQSRAALTELRRALSLAGLTVDQRLADPSLATDSLAAALGDADAIIVAGGDGSLSHAAPTIAASGRPVYHYPLGTENLFARHFNMTASPQALLAALRRGRVNQVDLAACGSRCFVLMASIGFDAAIVARVAAARTRGVRRVDYLRHSVAELLSHTPTPVTVEVDGRVIADRQIGLLFIANSAHYAARLNPCRDALIDDGLLNVLFLPYRTRAGLLARASAVAMRRHLGSRHALIVTGEAVRVRAEGAPLSIQIDGERLGPPPEHPDTFACRIVPRALNVLLPA